MHYTPSVCLAVRPVPVPFTERGDTPLCRHVGSTGGSPLLQQQIHTNKACCVSLCTLSGPL